MLVLDLRKNVLAGDATDLPIDGLLSSNERFMLAKYFWRSALQVPRCVHSVDRCFSREQGRGFAPWSGLLDWTISRIAVSFDRNSEWCAVSLVLRQRSGPGGSGTWMQRACPSQDGLLLSLSV